MQKINLKEFRLLHQKINNNIELVIMSGSEFIDVTQDTFRSSDGQHRVDRKIIRIAYQQRGLNTTSWSYWTNSSGTRMLNRKKKWRV